MNKHSAKGFTLIEILIVVSIIGVLSSLTLLGLGSFRASGRDVKRVTDLRQITNALELYYAKSGEYPANLDDLVAQGIIAKLPEDPISPKTDYEYNKCDTSGYVVQATLEEYNKKILAESAASACGMNCDNSDVGKEYCIKF